MLGNQDQFGIAFHQAASSKQIVGDFGFRNLWLALFVPRKLVEPVDKVALRWKEKGIEVDTRC